MARIAGVDIPKNKKLVIGLTYIHGIGKVTSEKVCGDLSLDPNMNTDTLTEELVAKIRDYLENNLTVEGDLRRQTALNIKRLIELQLSLIHI